MKKSELKKAIETAGYDAVLNLVAGIVKKTPKINSDLTRQIKDEPPDAMLALVSDIAWKKGDTIPGETAVQYIKAGRFRDVFKKQKDDSLTVWGYPKKSPVTKAVLKKRIAFMRKNIKSGTWQDRQLKFANHHLKALERQLNEFENEE